MATSSTFTGVYVNILRTYYFRFKFKFGQTVFSSPGRDLKELLCTTTTSWSTKRFPIFDTTSLLDILFTNV